MEENIKINIKIKNKGNLLANANLSLLTKDFGWINIKDFQIWRSSNLNSRLEDNINIQPPSINVHGKYIAKIFFEDIKKWEKIEEEIYYAYMRKTAEETKINEFKLFE